MRFYEMDYLCTSTAAPEGMPHFEEFKYWRNQMRHLANYIQGNSVELEVPHAR